MSKKEGGILEKEISIDEIKSKRKVQFITRTAILTALTLAIQMIGMPQYATGPLVNTMLYIGVTFVGILGGVIIGLITPIVAFWYGILPALLGPMVPFIALGNAVLVIIYGLVRKCNKFGGRYFQK